MNDTEFIELLNLYLDHEISPADATRLEAEVQRVPVRYRVYREYCQMHKACALLSLDHAVEVPATTAFESTRRTWANPFAIGGLMAAAACVAFVLLNRAPALTPSDGLAVMESSSPAAAAASNSKAALDASKSVQGIAQAETVSPHQAEFRATPVMHTLRLTSDEVATATVQDVRLNWIDALQLSSIPQVPADSLRFETKTAPKGNLRSFDSSPMQGPMEYNAIQFQR
jgi:hypothetical protein